MSRPKRRLPLLDSFPPPLDVFDPADWWVDDLEDFAEVQYARIRWVVARRAYQAGEDWTAHLQPPARQESGSAGLSHA